MDDSIPVLMHVEPVLAVNDVTATVNYWEEILGFGNKWTWGEPPNHGGVTWDGVFIQFSLDPSLASKSEGNSIWIRVRNLESLFELHQKKNAPIVSPLQSRPWGMDEYTVRELNGYYINFSAPSVEKKKSAQLQPAKVTIVERLPTAEEYRMLCRAVGWSDKGEDDLLTRLLSAPIYSLVAEDTTSKKAVGCVFLLGDYASFYYVKDLMVQPDWQHKGIGSMLMRRLTSWIEKNANENALVGLYTGEHLAAFYKEFGFAPVFGMNKRIRQKTGE